MKKLSPAHKNTTIALTKTLEALQNCKRKLNDERFFNRQLVRFVEHCTNLEYFPQDSEAQRWAFELTQYAKGRK